MACAKTETWPGQRCVVPAKSSFHLFHCSGSLFMCSLDGSDRSTPAPSSFYWKRQDLVEQLRPLDFGSQNELSEIERNYCAYYRIDMESRLPGVSHRLGYFESLGYRVALHVFRPAQARGTVLVMHGYFDHSGLYGHLIRDLLEQNLAVIIYDLPGHGISSGEPVSIRKFEDYQQVLDDGIATCCGHLPQPWYAVGQSTGGAVLLDNLLTHRYPQDQALFRHIVLLAPLVRPANFRKGVLLHTLVSPFLRTWKRAFTDNSNDSSFIRFVRRHDPLQSQVLSVEWVTALRKWVKRIEAMPPFEAQVTIVQGKQDTTVDWRHNLRVLRAKFPGVAIHYLPQKRHHLVNESQELREQIFAIIRTKFAAERETPSSD